jgi:hypothetical protein
LLSRENYLGTKGATSQIGAGGISPTGPQHFLMKKKGAQQRKSGDEEPASERWSRKAKEDERKTQASLKKMHLAEQKDRHDLASFIAVLHWHLPPADLCLELIVSTAAQLFLIGTRVRSVWAMTCLLRKASSYSDL